jgi:hypothetical protein
MAYLRSKKLPQRMRLARGEDDTAGGGLLAAAEGLLGCRLTGLPARKKKPGLFRGGDRPALIANRFFLAFRPWIPLNLHREFP